MPREGGMGRTQAKEAVTQFLYLLEDSQRPLCHSYSFGRSVGGAHPAGFLKRNINAVNLLWENH